LISGHGISGKLPAGAAKAEAVRNRDEARRVRRKGNNIGEIPQSKKRALLAR